MSRRHPHIANVDEVPPVEGPRAGRFTSVMRPLGRAAGGQKLGCTHYEIAPGAVAFPFHSHTANEEAVLVLEGEGAARIGGETLPIRPGDWIAFPPGPGAAHQIRNTGASTLRYVCISTMNTPELCGYPDSKKYGVAAVADGKPYIRQLFYEEDARGYFDREPDATAGEE